MTTSAPGLRFSPRVDRIAGESANAWQIHSQAVRRQRSGDDIIVLSIGDPETDTPLAVQEAAIAGIRAGHTKYISCAGIPALRTAIARWHEKLTGQTVRADQIIVTPGAQNGLYCAAQVLFSEGDEVIVPEPAYVTYEATLGSAGARMVHVPLLPDRDFLPDPADIAAAVTGRTRAILLNTPHNPSGAVIPREILAKIGAIAVRHDLWIICDEVYAALTFEAEHVSPAGLPGLGDRTVVVSSLSKSHAMTGWRVGWVVGPDPIAEHIDRLVLCMLYGSPEFVQDGALAALSLPHSEHEATRRMYRGRRDHLVRGLAAVPGLACHVPAAGMFVMVDVRGTGMGAQAFAQGLLDEQGVSVLPADAFGPSAVGHVRISLTTTEARLAEAADRIAAFVRVRTAG